MYAALSFQRFTTDTMEYEDTNAGNYFADFLANAKDKSILLFQKNKGKFELDFIGFLFL